MDTFSRYKWRGTRVKRERTRALRAAQTGAEALLWRYLRNRQLGGAKFRRQHLLCGYIVDFVCIRDKLIVELDGAVHQGREDDDDARTRVLEAAGYRVLRFTNDAVEQNIAAVLKIVSEHLR